MARIISAIILIPITLLVVIFATPGFYLVGIGVLGTICLHEYSGLMRAMSFHTRPLFLYGLFWILLVVFYLDRIPALPMLALTVIAAFISSLWRKKLSVRERATGLMAEMFGIFYITLFLYPALPIRYSFGNSRGLEWTLLMLLIIWGGDTFALIVGKKMGKRPFAPILSPKKTVEGAVGGLLAGVGITVAARYFLFTDLLFPHVLTASILLGIMGQLGDLGESLIKRAAGIKDSSQLIPGHGGILDRMDSLLFSIPVLYGYLLLIYR